MLVNKLFKSGVDMENDDIAAKVWEVCDMLHSKKKLITKRVVELVLQNSEYNFNIQQIADLQKYINSWRLRNLAVKASNIEVKYTPERFAEKIVKLETELCRLRSESSESKITINKLSAQISSLADKNSTLKSFIKKRITNMIETNAEIE
jgi:hypothetical protein